MFGVKVKGSGCSWGLKIEEFGQEAYGEYFDTFMRRYLTMKKGTVPKRYEGCDVFKQFCEWQNLLKQDSNEVNSFVSKNIFFDSFVISFQVGWNCA